MKTIATASALVALVALGSLSMGCSAENTGTGGRGNVNTGTALSALRSPTGTFSKATAQSAFSGYRKQRADSQHVSAPVPNGGGDANTASIRTVRLLDKATSSGSCSAGKECACPTGGSMSYASEQTADGPLVSVHFTACGFEDGLKFDGDAVLLASKKSLLGDAISSSSSSKAPSSSGGGGDDSDFGDGSGLKEAAHPSDASSSEYVALLLAAEGTASDGKQTEKLAFALLTEAGYAFLAVSVADGSLVIGVAPDGNAVVRSKDGTYKCKQASKGYVCTSEKGETLDVEDDGSTASNDAPSGPSGSPDDSDLPEDGSGF